MTSPQGSPPRQPWIFDDRIPVDLPDAALTQNARTVLERRYLKKDEDGTPLETPETMFWRVARVIAEEDRRFGASDAAVQELARQFYDLMTTGQFEPNSPTLMNAGRPLGQLSACFVLPVEDSLSNDKNGIYDTLKAMALVHQSGGGTGFGFSRLRPSGDTVRSTMGVASGPVSFMRLYDASTEVVKQGGTRRGANMGILRVDHPDIRRFIACKDDTSQVTNFNISVAITDDFMRAVKIGADYDLISPKTGQVVGQDNAQEVFNLIVDGAWKTGEPGVFFVDRANEYNPVPHLFSYEATNPCVTADTWVHTAEGPRQVFDLLGGATTVRVRGEDHDTTEAGFFRTGTKDVVRLETAEGFTIRLTPDHRVQRAASKTRHRIQEEWCAAGDLEPGDLVVLNDHRANHSWGGELTREEGYLLGLLLGDGTLKKDKAVLSVWAQAMAANDGQAGGLPTGIQAVMAEAETSARTLSHRSDFAGWMDVGRGGEHRMSLSAVRGLATGLGMTPAKGGKSITPAMERGSSDFYVGLLRGFFDADGSVQGNQTNGVSVRLAQSDLPVLRAVQRMLLRLGIASRLYTNRREAGLRELPDGKGGTASYKVQAQHELVIANDNLGLFRDRIGFGDTDKAGRMEDLLGSYARTPNRERFTATVTQVVADGTEDVYDVQVPGVNAFDANGMVVHNCGEQPLGPYDVCNLGSVNVGAFVKPTLNPSSRPEDRIDWEGLGQAVRLGVHFLDNVIDANHYPLEDITDLAQRIRRIGLGVMGWADMLVRLGVPYASDDAVELGRTLMSFVDEQCREASEQLAKTRGVFPEWPDSIWGPDETCATRKDGSRIRPLRRLRNSNLTTVAPTGTISIIAGCSGGIEPLFAVAFMRNQAGVMMPDVNPDFVGLAKAQGWYSDDLMERIATQGHIHFNEVPEAVQRVFMTAHDIQPEWHVRMQAGFQSHVDSAISKTTNFANEATKEDVRKIYDLAFDLGCKGVTVYRDGSRPHQVLSTGKTGSESAEAGESQASTENIQALVAEATTVLQSQLTDALQNNALLEQQLADARSELHQTRVQMDHLSQAAETQDVVARSKRHKRQRPSMLRGRTVKMNSPLGDLYVTVNEDEAGRPFEVFCTLGKAGGAAMADSEATGRLISLALRSGIPITAVKDQLRGISCDRAVGVGPNKVLSAPDAIAQAIEHYLMEKEGVQEELPMPAPAVEGAAAAVRSVVANHGADPFMGSCPECGAGQLAFEEGCMKCHVCGYSECG